MYTQPNRRWFLAAAAVALLCSFAITGFAVDTKKAKLKIALIDADGKVVKESLTGKLELNRKYVKGDRIVVFKAGGVYGISAGSENNGAKLSALPVRRVE